MCSYFDFKEKLFFYGFVSDGRLILNASCRTSFWTFIRELMCEKTGLSNAVIILNTLKCLKWSWPVWPLTPPVCPSCGLAADRCPARTVRRRGKIWIPTSSPWDGWNPVPAGIRPPGSLPSSQSCLVLRKNRSKFSFKGVLFSASKMVLTLPVGLSV